MIHQLIKKFQKLYCIRLYRENVLKRLVNSFLVPLELTKDLNDVIKIVNSLEESGLLITGVSGR